MKLHLIAIPAALCLVASAALGFTEECHQTIGAMADRLIENTEAGARARALLGSETLSAASTWADQVKGWGDQTAEMAQFTSNNPAHAQYHYTDIPFQEPKYFDSSVGATNIDVIHAIDACVAILQNKPQTLYKNVDAKTALRLLVHYIGDMHQPLHVGAGYLSATNYVNPNVVTNTSVADRGGNSLMYKGKRLHLLWDLDYVRAAMTNAGVATPAEYASRLLARPAPARAGGSFETWTRQWAGESLVLSLKVHSLAVVASETYTDSRSGQLHSQWVLEPANSEYDKWAAAAVDDQILKAGHRLADLLQAIWPQPKTAQ